MFTRNRERSETVEWGGGTSDRLLVEKDGTVHEITPGAIHVLDEHDPHELRGGETEDMHLVSIFNPPITGDEKHTLSADGYSSY